MVPESENQFVDLVHSAFQTDDAFKVVRKRTNLAKKGFEDIWRTWWSGDLPPKLEVDLILALKDVCEEIDEALLVGIEVKYFRPVRGGRVQGNFFEGLQQALAYMLFGFDGISLWHVFHSSLSQETVCSYAQAMKQIIDEFELPVFYLATRLTPQEDEIRLEGFAPAQLYEPVGLEYFARWIKTCFGNDGMRNPMRGRDEVRRRRGVLKTFLGIPV